MKLLAALFSLIIISHATIAAERNEVIREARDLRNSLNALQELSDDLADRTSSRRVRMILLDASQQADNLVDDLQSEIIRPLRRGASFRQVLANLQSLELDLEELIAVVESLRRLPPALEQALLLAETDFLTLKRKLIEGETPEPGPGPKPDPEDTWVCTVADQNGNTYRGFGIREGQATNNAFDNCFTNTNRCSLIGCKQIP